MTSIGTSFDHYVEDFLADFNEVQREQILSLFRDIMQRLCNGVDPALTELTDLRLHLGDRVERVCEFDHRLRLSKLELDSVDARAFDHAPEYAARHAKLVGWFAERRQRIDDFYRASVEVGERVEEAMEPRVVDIFCHMVLAVQEHVDEHAALN
jgi:hypothetical protein